MLIYMSMLLKLIIPQACAESNFINQRNDLHCLINIKALMNFLYNNQCVQIILDNNKRFPVNCIADIIKNSENITVYTRSMAWLMKRDIYKEEIISDYVGNITTRFCENYLIFLDKVDSIKSILTLKDPKNTTKNFFPFSKIYFMVENLNYSSYEIISNIFYNRSIFGYIIEFNPLTKIFFGLRDILTLNHIVVSDYQKTNFIHPFLDRKNPKKVFRISFHECFPYVLYTDEENLR